MSLLKFAMRSKMLISYVTFFFLALGLAFLGRFISDIIQKGQSKETDQHATGDFWIALLVYAVPFALWIIGANGTGSWEFGRIIGEIWFFPITIFEGIEKLLFQGQDLNGFTERYHFSV
jgi:hypothetical protein